MKFSLVAAADKKMGIGIANRLPWRLKGDLKFFSELTTGSAGKDCFLNAVIMGRKTWESLPEAHRPLAGRINIVLSRSGLNVPENTQVFGSIEEALNMLNNWKNRDLKLGKVFVIGGANVYTQAITHADCESIYLTEVLGEFNCDAFFPKIPAEFKRASESEIHTENNVSYRFVRFVKG